MSGKICAIALTEQDREKLEKATLNLAHSIAEIVDEKGPLPATVQTSIISELTLVAISTLAEATFRSIRKYHEDMVRERYGDERRV